MLNKEINSEETIEGDLIPDALNLVNQGILDKGQANSAGVSVRSH